LRAATVPTQTAAGRGHLYAVDVVRFLTVAGVIAVHSTSLTVGSTPRGEVAAGVLLTLVHVTRSVFLFLTAFVLGYRYRGEVVNKRAFWRRRYWLVAVPYVAWSLIYCLADGHLTSPEAVLARFVRDLFTGGARFHLYFLLITFQLYAVFPWVLEWVKRVDPWRLLAGSLVVQLLFTAGTHYWAGAPSVLGLILHHPGSWLYSYQLYVIAGVLAALHMDAVTRWVSAHGWLVVAFTVVSVAIGMASYGLDLGLLGMSPIKAGEVFQPAVVFEGLAAIAAQYALGLKVDRFAGARLRWRLNTSSDVSFGVYLAHPLLLQGLLAVTVAIGLDRALSGLAPALQLVLVVVVLVPAVYGVTGTGMVLLRRTGLSLALAGRKGRLPVYKEQADPSPPVPAQAAAIPAVAQTSTAAEPGATAHAQTLGDPAAAHAQAPVADQGAGFKPAMGSF
jgi:membrane-bound acyltransferase YfiQ involved in biofilm formation